MRWLDMLAIGLVAYKITESAFVVAMLAMLRLLPMGLFGALLGAASERIDRRAGLIASVLVSLLATLALALLASFDVLAVWHMAVASFVNGVCWATDNPVRRMMIGDVVGAESMGAAMSLDAGTNNATRVAGPIVGGLLLATLGVASVFWLGVVLYGLGLAAALRVRLRRGPAAVASDTISAILADGFRYVAANDRLLGIFAVTVIYNVFGWPYTSMIPVIGTDYLQLGPTGVGVLASFDGIGGLVGAVLLGLLARPAWYGHVYVTAVGLYLLLMMAFAVAPNAALAALVLTVTGLCGTGFAVMQATLVYRSSPQAMRARLLGVLSLCIGTGPIGFVYLGFLAEQLTPRVGIVALAAQGLVALLLTRRWWSLALRP